MSEVRIRPRQVLILIIVFLVILLMVHRNGKRNCQDLEQHNSRPLIYAITPTYTRPAQKAELTRLSHVFMLVPNLYWIIVEDANATSNLVKNLLSRANLEKRSTLLNVKTPPAFKLREKEPKWVKPRGVEQRNMALSWIHSNANHNEHSMVFFMDDDNAYSVELFKEITKIEQGRVGVWPVGLVGGLLVERPLLNEDKTEVIGFNAAWRPERPFPIDMAGFAIATDLFFKNPKASFSYEVQRGYQESEILRHFTTLKELQPLANKCQDVLVWHTRTEPTKLANEEALKKKGLRSDAGIEV